jgi:Family of unknown function (DUF6228)
MCNSGRVTELVLDGMNGRRVRLWAAQPPDADEIWSYQVSVQMPEGHLQVRVWDSGVDLARFLRELADAWRGFDGVKSYQSLEGQFALDCQHDGKGTVECVLTLRRPGPPEWTLSAAVDFGSGAHLDRIALDAEDFVRRRG